MADIIIYIYMRYSTIIINNYVYSCVHSVIMYVANYIIRMRIKARSQHPLAFAVRKMVSTGDYRGELFFLALLLSTAVQFSVVIGQQGMKLERHDVDRGLYLCLVAWAVVSRVESRKINTKNVIVVTVCQL